MQDQPSLAELLNKIPELFNYSELCKMSDEATTTYQTLLDCFQKVNGTQTSRAEKGVALEKLVAFLLQISGNVFTVVQNVQTATNEIDELVQLNQKGRVLLSAGLLPKRFELFLGECKNHQTSIGVNYVGKFYSLLQTTQTKTGILFSYHGISGSGWQNGSGLVKKIYLQRERDEDRVAVIDFCIHDFQAIADGSNFFEIVEQKLAALRFDTSIDAFVSQHPAETTFSTLLS